MKLAQAVVAIQTSVTKRVTALDPLVMAVSAALGCVAAEDLYLSPQDRGVTEADTDATALIDVVRPVLAVGDVVDAWHQQVLVDAGTNHVRVIPQPRVVVIAVDDGAHLARTSALVSMLTLSGTLTLPAHADVGSDLDDVIDDQLVRADLMLICASQSAQGRINAALANLGSVTGPLWSSSSLPDVRMATLGTDSVPTLVLPETPEAQLAAFALVVQPMLAAMLGMTDVEPVTEPSVDTRKSDASEAGAECATSSDRPLQLDGISCSLTAADGSAIGPGRSAAAVQFCDATGDAVTYPLPQPALRNLLAMKVL